MKGLKIKTKKDWCLAFLFMTIIVYGISTRFSATFQAWLLQYGHPMLTNMNQPKSYGNVMFTIIVMVIITEIILVVYKKRIWLMCLITVAGVVSVAAVFGMYIINTERIVSVIEEEEPGSVTIGYWAGEDLDLDETQKREIAALCEELEPVSEEKEVELEEEFYADGEYTVESVLIWAYYPEKYGHNFSLMVCVHGDKVFIGKGYGNDQREIVTFFEDNGIIEALGK